MEQRKVLLIGGGGREHALAHALSKSSLLDKLYITPGNPGTAQHGENVSLDINEFDDVVDFCEDHHIDLVIVGPEQPLVEGITDYLHDYGIKVFGPTKGAAMLEGSKSYAKSIMQKYNIPTAGSEVFERHEVSKLDAYLAEEVRFPVVIKVDGLAAGKGVFICNDIDQAREYIDKIMNDVDLSAAAPLIVVEEFMQGEEVSVFAISDGSTAHYLMHAQDHKRIGDGDTGLNTGGMGAYAPAPVLTEQMRDHVMKTIVQPTIDGMAQEETPYLGILYVGLMMTADGPKVVEYNCRFGDPEAQVILPAIKSDVLELMITAVNGKLEYVSLDIDTDYYCSVVLASKGYPGSYEKGKIITGLNDLPEDVYVYHSGTEMSEEGQLLTKGGRVLNVVGSGSSLKEAIDNAYAGVAAISFDGAYHRKDIGAKGLAHFNK
ncbi:MAG: phosphoribosylamine--glycine ligase [Bacteroidetes bacterium]|nr:phosphoribosylamine--glycine ligase [Bacteroidota bacterium]MCH8525296.1 phosphoribosylamine--glycine ligase [Balneolales bacterium]